MSLFMKYTIGYPAGEKNFSSYEPSVSADLLEQELERVKPRDLKQCQTSVGPHRDDLLFPLQVLISVNLVHRGSREPLHSL